MGSDINHTGGASGQTWIDLCQKSRTDPRELVEKHLDRVLKVILEASTVNSKVRPPTTFSVLVFC